MIMYGMRETSQVKGKRKAAPRVPCPMLSVAGVTRAFAFYRIFTVAKAIPAKTIARSQKRVTVWVSVQPPRWKW